MAKDNIFRILCYVIVIVFFLKLVVYHLVREVVNYLKFWRYGKIGAGKIIEIKEAEDQDGLLMYYPVIEYVFENKFYYLSPIEERSSAKPEIGKQVSILHERSDPQKATLYTAGTIIHLFLKIFFVLLILAVLSVPLFKML